MLYEFNEHGSKSSKTKYNFIGNLLSLKGKGVWKNIQDEITLSHTIKIWTKDYSPK